MVAWTEAGLPSGPMEGLNRHLRTASTVFSSKPIPKPFET
jgi:hypothetical protein